MRIKGNAFFHLNVIQNISCGAEHVDDEEELVRQFVVEELSIGLCTVATEFFGEFCITYPALIGDNVVQDIGICIIGNK